MSRLKASAISPQLHLIGGEVTVVLQAELHVEVAEVRASADRSCLKLFHTSTRTSIPKASRLRTSSAPHAVDPIHFAHAHTY